MACGGLPSRPGKPGEEVRYLPSRSLLLPAPVAEWPETLTNSELLALARGWRAQVVACNADKVAIEADAFGATEAPVAVPAKPWWRFW
jgi:hypothetical protein